MNLASASIVHRLDAAEQLEWVSQVREVCRASPLVRPSTPSGQPMRVRVTAAGALGWTGGPGGYAYSPTDQRGRPWPGMPATWRELADRVAGPHPWDSAIINWYEPEAALGWHVDKAEHRRDLPIVTVSLGDAAAWGIRDAEGKAHRCRLESGDVTLLSGPTRSLAHTIERLIECPLLSPLKSRGRVSVTIRVAGDTSARSSEDASRVDARHVAASSGRHVDAGRERRKHRCHAIGCELPCKPEFLMCVGHWRRVPKTIQFEVWKHYRPGQCDDMDPSEAWHAAADRAIASVAVDEKKWTREQADGWLARNGVRK